MVQMRQIIKSFYLTHYTTNASRIVKILNSYMEPFSQGAFTYYFLVIFLPSAVLVRKRSKESTAHPTANMVASFTSYHS